MRIFRWEADHSMDINLDDSNLDWMQSYLGAIDIQMQLNASNFIGIYFSVSISDKPLVLPVVA